MEKEDSLALCIPAYNAAKYINDLLLSAKNQNIPFDEILVYDDCSSDHTALIAERFGATVVRGAENKGCSFGKNALAAAAKSKWLHFHDADDILLPNFTAVATKWMNNPNPPDIILLNFEYRDYTNNYLIDTAAYDINALEADPIKFVITNKLVNFAICNREKFLNIGGFNLDQEVLYNEDRAFYVRAISHALTFGYEPEVTCINYRFENSMSSSNLLKCAYSHYHVSNILAEKFGSQYPQEIAEAYWTNATAAASFKDWKLTEMNINGAKALNSKFPKSGNKLFNFLCAISPLTTYKFRENMIRIFKPTLRANPMFN